MRRAPAAAAWIIVAASLAAMAVLSVGSGRHVIDAANRQLVPATIVTLRKELKIDVSVGRVKPDLLGGRLEAENLRARGATGDPLASVGRSLVLFPVPWRPRPNVHVEISDAVAWLRREPDGRFEFQRYIPKRPPTAPAVQPVEIFVRGARVEYQDFSGQRPSRATLSGLSGAVQFAGRSGHGTIHGATEALGRFNGRGDWEGKAGHVAFAVSEADAETVLAAIASNAPRLLPKTLGVARTKGAVTGCLSWGPKGIGDWVVTGRLRGARFAYDGYSASDFSADMTVGPLGVSGSATAITGFGRGSATGTVHVTNRNSSVALNVDGAGANARALWRRLIPSIEPPVSGHYIAHVAVIGATSALSVRGTLTVESARWRKYKGSNISGYVAYDADKRLDLRNLRGSVLGAPVTAEVEYDFGRRYLKLAGDTTSADLARLDEARKQGLSGKASAHAVFDAPLSRPYLLINIDGSNLHISRPIRRDIEPWTGNVGDALARVVWHDDRVDLPLVGVSGPIGRLRASGGYKTTTGDLTMAFDAAGITLDALKPQEDVSGTAFASGKLTGTTNAPVVDAWLEVYAPSVGGYDASLASGQVTYRDGVVRVADASLRRGAGIAEIVGDLDLNGSTPIARDVRANVKDLDIRQVLGEAHASLPLRGLLNAAISASGPTDNISAQGTVSSSGVAVDNVTADSASAEFGYSDHVLHVPNLTAAVAGGTLEGSGAIDPDGQTAMDFTIKDVGLNALSSYMDPSTPLAGTIAGTARLTGDHDRLSATANASLASVVLAGLPFGNGTATAKLSDNAWSGHLDLSQETRRAARTVHADLTRLDTSARTIQLSADAHMSMIDVRRLTRSMWRDIPGQLWQALYQVNGGVEAKAEARGSLDDATYPFELTSSNMEIGGTPRGSLVAKGEIHGDLYKFDQIKWDFPDGNAVASGTIQPRGSVEGTADIHNLDLESIAPFSPALAGIAGHVDSTASFVGNSDSPEIDLSVGLHGFGMRPEGAPASEPPATLLTSADFARVTVKEGSISTDGAVLQKEGYVARLSGSLPFHYRPTFGIPDNEPVRAELTIREQPLAGLHALWQRLDEKTTKGRIMGAQSGPASERPIVVAIGGTLADPQLHGDLYFEGDTVGFTNVSETIRNFRGHLGLQGNHAVIDSVEAHTASGGTLTAKADIALNAGAGSAGEGVARAGTLVRQIMQSPVSGEVKLDALTYKHPDRDATKRVNATVTGTVALAGTLGKPALSGNLKLLGTELPAPSAFDTGAASVTRLIDPQFDLTFDILPGSTIRNSQLQAKVAGRATLERSLSSPRLSANVDMLSGRIRLPTASLNLRPGSSVSIAYDAQAGPDALATATVDLYGSTHVTSVNAFGTPVDYRVDMHVTGSLLEEDGLHISATSSPPDLSQQQILGLLGHQELFESIGSQTGGNALQTELKDAFASAVLPSLLPDIGGQLKLEELSFTVNKYEPLTVNISKALFDGVTMSYRRTLEGIDIRYQVKLLWRLPIHQRFRGDFDIALTYNEQHQHGIGLEWATRF